MNKVEKIFFNNQWQLSNSKKKYSRNSFHYNNKYIYPDCNSQDLKKVILSAEQGLKINSELSYKTKSKFLYSIYKGILINIKILARLEASETGKLLKQAEQEIQHAANIWLHASKITKNLDYKKKLDKLHDGLVVYEPVGIVSLIVPWNFPFIVASERLPYILAAGNSVIIKPSEFASQSIYYLINIIKKNQYPSGIINLITGIGDNIGKKIVNNKEINMISFTGSTKVGKKIMSSSGKTIKRLSLELGGKNSLIALEDAHIKNTVDIIIKGFTLNAGQTCVATSKVLVHHKIKKTLIDSLVKELSKIKNFKKIYGPITTQRQKEKIKAILLQNEKFNKNIVFGKSIFVKDFINPIVFKDLPLNNTINTNEIFGPILSINSFENENEMIKIANSTDDGLSLVICGQNKKKALSIARKIKSGRIWINQAIDKNFAELPIGGFKESGLNRECGKDGIRTYSEIKSIIIKK